MPYTVPRNLKEISNYTAEGHVTITSRKCNISGTCPGTVNVNFGPVYYAFGLMCPYREV